MNADPERAFQAAQDRILAARAEQAAADAANPVKCHECGTAIEGLDPPLRRLYARHYCPDCIEKKRQARLEAEQKRAAELAAEQARRLAADLAAAAERTAAELAAVRADPAGFLARARVPGIFHRASFAAAREARDLPAALIDAAERWASAPSGFLVLTGPPGAGKTWLAVAVLRAALEAGTVRPGQAGFLTEAKFLASVELDYGTPRRSKAYDDLPLLAYDDLGACYVNDLRRAALGELLRERWNGERATIITSNLTLAEIADLDGRIASVLAAGRNVLAFPPADLRRTGNL